MHGEAAFIKAMTKPAKISIKGSHKSVCAIKVWIDDRPKIRDAVVSADMRSELAK